MDGSLNNLEKEGEDHEFEKIEKKFYGRSPHN
jgi:hypothetical protein